MPHGQPQVQPIGVSIHPTSGARLVALPPGPLTQQLPVQRPDVAVPAIELFL
ncbi:hypothetical protein ACIBI9_37730 [Nonomuraea sp. NPDC050451]|uniref:hypothetical protein n=1 Tax=Nonomuraea sp. NPDC050451 TaxID=3364364 RepID=UPI0037B80663